MKQARRIVSLKGRRFLQPLTKTSKLRADKDWVSDLSAGGSCREEALADLRKILVAGLARAFRQSTSDLALIQDSAQEALLLIISRIHTYRGDSRFVTWALSIGTRLILSEMRRARWHDVSLDEMSEAGKLSSACGQISPVSLNYDRGQLLAVVRNAIEQDLTPKQRNAIQAELAGAPPEEIAQRLGTNRNALYKVIHDARARLKQAILRSGWSEEHIRSVLKES